MQKKILDKIQLPSMTKARSKLETVEIFPKLIKNIYKTPFPVAQMVKCLPTMWETWVWSLGWEDLLEKEMATHSSILAWKIPWTEERCRLQSMGLQRVGHDWASFTLQNSLTNIINGEKLQTSPLRLGI